MTSSAAARGGTSCWAGVERTGSLDRPAETSWSAGPAGTSSRAGPGSTGRSSRRGSLLAAALLLAALALAPASGATTLHGGDALIADPRYPGPSSDPLGGSGAIVRVAPNGSRSVIVAAHGLIEPKDLDLLRSGKLVVVDRGENGPATPDRNGR